MSPNSMTRDFLCNLEADEVCQENWSTNGYWTLAIPVVIVVAVVIALIVVL